MKTLLIIAVIANVAFIIWATRNYFNSTKITSELQAVKFWNGWYVTESCRRVSGPFISKYDAKNKINEIKSR